MKKDMKQMPMMKKPMADSGPGDMATAAKLKVLGHLKNMASGMMGNNIKAGMMPQQSPVPTPPMAGGSSVVPGYAKGGVVAGDKYGNYNMKGSHQENTGSADSEGLDDHDGDEEPSVAMHNKMDNESTAEDYNEQHTPESIEAELSRLKEMKRRLTER